MLIIIGAEELPARQSRRPDPAVRTNKPWINSSWVHANDEFSFCSWQLNLHFWMLIIQKIQQPQSNSGKQRSLVEVGKFICSSKGGTNREEIWYDLLCTVSSLISKWQHKWMFISRESTKSKGIAPYKWCSFGIPQVKDSNSCNNKIHFAVPT